VERRSGADVLLNQWSGWLRGDVKRVQCEWSGDTRLLGFVIVNGIVNMPAPGVEW
jgi:hypothetical protein